MSGFEPTGRPIGPLARDVLAVVVEATEPGEGLPREAAVERIKRATVVDDERLWVTDDADALEPEIEDVIDRLLNLGHLYAVEGEVYVTDREGVDRPADA